MQSHLQQCVLLPSSELRGCLQAPAQDRAQRWDKLAAVAFVEATVALTKVDPRLEDPGRKVVTWNHRATATDYLTTSLLLRAEREPVLTVRPGASVKVTLGAAVSPAGL